MMPGSLILSGVGHCLALAALYLGLPHLWVDEPVNERVVIVDLVTVKQDRNLPEMANNENEDPKPEVEPVAVPAPPPPPAPSPPTTQRSVAANSEEVALPAPKPKELQEEVKLADEGKVAHLPGGVVPQFEKPISRARPAPAVKPDVSKKSDPFASVLKSVEELEEEGPRHHADLEEKSPDSVSDPIEEILAEANSEFVETAPLSMTELDSIRYQIQKNWNLPAGGRDAHNMKVTLHILLGRDGTVLDVTVVNLVQTQTDPFFRAMAESAVRAVLKTQKIRYLSSDKYHLWRDMKLNFDPSDMFG